ncbi:MAG: NAD(P)H-dependent oxidoreductase [Clostridium sp.]|jgi:putative NADPH-quinone reductase|uniref:NAD(P)H-dependent oxidoreductase n=1 Tax=Clostridium sp. TaxID=1506 RepID=UPI0025BCF98C|nr:NAD(P)H-dependent oxidoreductase [Clostridium sp.]MCH3963933.1 NAD(P)H-dependent oxidoreductase [Clostridium sp.]MCI1716134.1 NAD(P)H-dependent oxidoreductase [Clostridium sp.]MCI1800626.1 NAD(P)H-dependent oxidoreductase [Clostridium sp.]MCI1814311.1 NAD(P)H-dependent oxidoreductase [Clostridium sp.]MCI1871210.1 NAD(P)H-dependent oxidoreductase [Clostridium sp.]
MKALVILTHPDIENSRVNKIWKQELVKYPDDIEIHELYRDYPDWKIDVEKEQGLLDIHNYIIFQFPVYWYSYPPLLKKWLDDVFTHGWAYGSNGHKLEGKKFGLALSIGDKRENYSHTGSVGFTVDEVITPFKASANHVGAIVLPHFAFFGSSFQATDDEVDQSAKDYVEYILKYNT